MEFIVKHPCTCILDNEPNVCDINYGIERDRSYRLKKSKKKKKYVIMEGSESEISWKKQVIKTIRVLVPNVNLTISRSCCRDELNLYVCTGSCIWLQGFDDIFPQINIYCEGKVTSSKFDDNFVADEINIYMGPDYINQSIVEGFQAVSMLNILYQYNGIISGYIEQLCDVKYPHESCMGKISKYIINKIGKRRQREINNYRKSEGYNILTTRYEKAKPSPYIDDTECIRCNETSDNLLWLSPCEHRLCYDCLMIQYDNTDSHLKPPYFDCPNIICRKNVMDIHRIK